LPPSATIENGEKLKAWTEEHYSSPNFSQCQHQQHPLRTDLSFCQPQAGPRAKPVAVHQPVPNIEINPLEKYCYKVAPQGLLVAGHADMAKMSVNKKKQLVDDNCMYKTNQAENYMDTCRLISMSSSAGNGFNKKQFQLP
jgi:hypothetical protein